MRRLQLFRSFATAVAPKIRNIGIIAHIDAGKTTTTERMLFYAGLTKRLGNVDSGDTVTDFLPAERERGITIQSAAISFQWSNHQINLVDTPGHADFAFEVVRSLRVLDGAIAILDGVAGVEALTESVWARTRAYGIPVIAFINKMDRPGAGYARTVREIVNRLRTPVAQVMIPWYDGDNFAGVLDVINRKRICWSGDGREVTVHDAVCETEEAHAALIDTMSELSEEVLNEFVETGQVAASVLRAALRQATLECRIVPVLCGASFRNIGVQPLMDAVVDYLPAPKSSGIKGTVTALAFKVRQDPMLGPLVYIRVYDGKLKKGFTLLNTSTGEREKPSKLMYMQADEPYEVNELGEGAIGVLVGTKGIRTGDTIVAHPNKPSGAISSAQRNVSLLPIEIPPSVFVARISPRGVADQRAMTAALDVLLREDPSLRLAYDEESGQWLLSGLGRLHLEIACDRLVRDLKANVDVGPAMITFKETISRSAAATVCVDAGQGQIRVRCDVSPAEDGLGKRLPDHHWLLTTFKRHPVISSERIEAETTIGITPVLAQGRIARLALYGIQVNVNVEVPPDVVDAPNIGTLVREAATRAFSELADSDFCLLEPLMQVTITIPEGDTGAVMQDLTGLRHGQIEAVGESGQSTGESHKFADLAESMWVPYDSTLHLAKHVAAQQRLVTVKAFVPLRMLIDYAATLRSISQGRGSFESSFARYENVPSQDLEDVLEMV